MGRQGRQLVLETGSLEAMVEGYQRMAIEAYDARVKPHREPLHASKKITAG